MINRVCPKQQLNCFESWRVLIKNPDPEVRPIPLKTSLYRPRPISSTTPLLWLKAREAAVTPVTCCTLSRTCPSTPIICSFSQLLWSPTPLPSGGKTFLWTTASLVWRQLWRLRKGSETPWWLQPLKTVRQWSTVPQRSQSCPDFGFLLQFSQCVVRG